MNIDPATTADLRASMNGTVLVPGDAAFEQARNIWNASTDRTPALIALCSETADVQRALATATEIGVPIASRSDRNERGPHGS